MRTERVTMVTISISTDITYFELITQSGYAKENRIYGTTGGRLDEDPPSSAYEKRQVPRWLGSPGYSRLVEPGI